MGFLAISIDKYIKKHLKSNPSANEKDLRKRLNSAVEPDKNGVKCSCGNDIWVIGSASVGNSCFTCITGESQPDSNYEIDSVLKKREGKRGRRHINEMDITKICGIFDDDGYEINSELIKKPALCLICVNNDNANEDLLCNLTRFDQRNDREFKCFAFLKND